MSRNRMAIGLFVLAIVGALAGELISGSSTTRQDRAKTLLKIEEMEDRVAALQKQLETLKAETKSSAADTPDTAFLADHFKYRIPVSTGFSESHEGGQIDIREVWGTRPNIEIGGQYLVKGRYTLPANEKGRLHFYLTATTGSGTSATMDLQTIALDAPSGEFAVVHGMAEPGYFHLYLAAPDRYSRCFANVYFGTGSNVYRKN